MRKLFIIILAFFLGFPAYSAQMVNVEYIHNAIAQKWDITVPYNPALTNPRVAVNMKYLLSAVDVANKMLNGTATEYGKGPYATLAAADTVATNDAVGRLVNITPVFFLTTTADTVTFSFTIAARGVFLVDWGDGAVETLRRSDAGAAAVGHSYATPGTYTIGIGGRASGYSADAATSAISFNANNNLARISGSIGHIFATLTDGTQPRFYNTFAGCKNLSGSIPENLFDGINGAPVRNMFGGTFKNSSGIKGRIPSRLFAGLVGAPKEYLFSETFSGCVGLTGSIPDNLFAGISGRPAIYMFDRTFFNCTGLSGEIPNGFFSTIQGTPSEGMFNATFYGCRGLTGKIPDGLFSGISGLARPYMFYNTFNGCVGLTSIGEKLFGNLSGDSTSRMFEQTFYRCTSLTGPSAQMLGGDYLYDVWPNPGTEAQNCYSGATGLSDYDAIPAAWK